MNVKAKIDERILAEARLLGGHETDEEAVTAALKAYIERRRQLAIMKLAGTIDFEPEYDYKKERQMVRGKRTIGKK